MNIDKENEIPEVEPDIPENAVSVYGADEDAMEEFPVLKAFQQYIDNEQSKARKRMLTLCVFFGVVLVLVIGVFMTILANLGNRNQSLNDRLVEYAMNERTRNAEATAQQLKLAQQDNATILALNQKIEALQKVISESEEKARIAVAQAAEKAKAEAEEAAKPKGPTKEEKQIAELRTLLELEREKLAAEKEKQHQAEIEAYRRKYYPELYQSKGKKSSRTTIEEKPLPEDDIDDEELDDDDAINYFDETGDDDDIDYVLPKRSSVNKAKSKRVAAPSKPAKKYSIPVDVKGSSSDWDIPE